MTQLQSRRTLISFLQRCVALTCICGAAQRGSAQPLEVPAAPRPATQPEAVAGPEDAPGEPSVKPTTRDSRFSRPAEGEILFQEGVMEYSRGNLRKAESNFQGVIEQDPADAEAYYYLGLAQLDQNKARSAAESFTQSLRLDPTSDEVRAARASAFIRQNKFKEAEEDIRVLQADPRWEGLVNYLQGHLYYRQGKLMLAAESFRAAERTGGAEAGTAKLYEGLTYYRMRDFAEARRSFRDATGADSTLTEPLGAELDISVGRREIRARRLRARLSLGYEFDTNVIQLGTDSPLPTGITGESDTAIVAQPSIGYAFIREGKFEAGLEGSGYFSYHDELTEFDIASYQAGPYASYRPSPTTKFDIRYGYNDLYLDDDDYLTRQLVTPSFLWIQPELGYTRVYYQFQSLRYSQPVTLEPFDRDGETHRAAIAQGFFLPEWFEETDKSVLEISYRFDHQETEGNDFDGNFHTAQLAYFVSLPWNIRADVAGSVSYEGYKNPNSIENNPLVIEAIDDEREDLEVRASAGITKKFTEWMSFRVDYSYTENYSNIETAAGTEPYDFDRHVVGARLILTY